MPFLKNAWYAAAWEDEVAPGSLFHRKLLGEEVLLMRDSTGTVHAMQDRCPHRFAPLHLGECIGDTIQCAYHGLQFGMDGACVFNPHGDGRFPPNARAKTYPLVAKNTLLWIWMGDSAKADQSRIPELIGLDTARFAINKGYMHTPANYEYITDNIMDLGHIEFLHKGLLGSEAIRSAETEVKRDGDIVHSNRLARNEILPPALEAVFESGGAPVDRWLDVTWYPPGNMQLVVGVAPAGAPERIGKESPGVHLMTPETEDTTHYFWSSARDFRVDDTQLTEALDQGLRYAFEFQDKPMIMAQQEALNGEDFLDLDPVILSGDAGAMWARRTLRKMLKEEQAALI